MPPKYNMGGFLRRNELNAFVSQSAHVNAVENLVVFAPLVLIANARGITGAAIATSAAVYFWARVVHAIAYTFAVPWVRTLAFTVGFLSQACIAWQILAH